MPCRLPPRGEGFRERNLEAFPFGKAFGGCGGAFLEKSLTSASLRAFFPKMLPADHSVCLPADNLAETESIPAAHDIPFYSKLFGGVRGSLFLEKGPTKRIPHNASFASPIHSKRVICPVARVLGRLIRRWLEEPRKRREISLRLQTKRPSTRTSMRESISSVTSQRG